MDIRRVVTLVGLVALVAGCGDAGTTPASTAGTPAPTAPGTPPVPTAAASGSPTAAPSAALWTGPALTTKPMSAEDAAAIDGLASSALQEAPGLNGMWLGVWDPAKGFYEQAYGYAVKDGAKASIDDHLQIGSVTKTFTVTAILEQVAAGRVALDSTIKDVLPDLAATYPTIADVTVRQLAGMQSPIQDYANTGVTIKKAVDEPKHVFTPDELIADGMSLPLVGPDKYGYSTTNTIILGQMLEKLTGKPVDQVVTDVAGQLGMAQTSLPPAASQTVMPAPAAHAYLDETTAQGLGALGIQVAAGTDITDWTLSWGGAGGAMYSTIADMGTWAGSGLGTTLLPVELAEQRFVFNTIPEGSYGLGFLEWGNGWVGHTGQTLGMESIVAYNRNTGAAFVAVVNSGGSLIAAKALATILFPDLKKLL